MILFSPEMDRFIINSDWEIKPFDLKLINNLERNYPYQKLYFMFMIIMLLMLMKLKVIYWMKLTILSY